MRHLKMIWIFRFLLNHDSSLLFRPKQPPSVLILWSLWKMCSWESWPRICHLSSHPWSLGDILLPAPHCSSPTPIGGLWQEPCGNLATVLNVEAAGAAARGKFATLGWSQPGLRSCTRRGAESPPCRRQRCGHLLLLAQASWQSPLLFF